MPPKRPSLGLPDVNFSDYGDVRCLHLGTEWVQGSMWIDRPYDIELEYVQRMMAWMLFVPQDALARCHAMQLGLGAASLTKFCRKRLRIRTTAVEINPQVVSACRLWFKLPPDDSKLRVLLADAADLVQQPQWHASVDALQIDLYDQDAAAPVLDSAEFYADCRQLLTEQGCLTVNLFGRSSSFGLTLDKLRHVFGSSALWAFKPTREGNTVVLAQRVAQPLARPVLAERAEHIRHQWGLPAHKWLRVFKALGS